MPRRDEYLGGDGFGPDMVRSPPRSRGGGKIHYASKHSKTRSCCGLEHYTEYPVNLTKTPEDVTCKTCRKIAGLGLEPLAPEAKPTVWDRLLDDPV